MAEPRVYQRVGNTAVTPSDYDFSVGKLAIVFDGVDDSLSTNSINFTSTDKMSVFAGVRKLSDAATGTLVSALGGSAGYFEFFAPVGASPSYEYRSIGTGGVLAQATVSTGYSAPLSGVLTAQSNISGDSATLRFNGTQVASSSADQGTGNFSNTPLYIGRRNNASLPYNGNLYSMIIVGKAVNASELSSTEKYVNTKTGAY